MECSEQGLAESSRTSWAYKRTNKAVEERCYKIRHKQKTVKDGNNGKDAGRNAKKNDVALAQERTQ